MKEGKSCPFSNAPCNDDCALYCIGLKACVLHGINANLQQPKE